MDVKGKLVEIVEKASARTLPKNTCHTNIVMLVNTLVEEGVTVQEWIPVKERLPQENEPEGKVCEQVQVLLINGAVSTGWCNRLTKMWWHLGYGETKFVGYEYDNTPVIAWQPLAQPPKGE